MEEILKTLLAGGNVIPSNPALRESPDAVSQGLEDAGLEGHCAFRTSGSTAEPKYACLSLDALMASARAVNSFLGVEVEDVWLNALPRFHVGGFGVELRAQVAGCRLEFSDEKWNPGSFVTRCGESNATHTALVPAQLHDLAKGQFSCPPRLRVVLAGGGWLDPAVWSRLRELGWPIRMTYGMTEACSQVATDPGDGKMRILPIWATLVDSEGRLAIKGPALLTGYLLREGGRFRFDSPVDGEGWFPTQDLVRIEGEALEFMGRTDRRVKVLGELIDLDALEKKAQGMPGIEVGQFAIVPIPEDRRGFVLVGMLVCGIHEEGRELLDQFNNAVAGFERLTDVIVVETIPRTALGKVDRAALKVIVESRSVDS